MQRALLLVALVALPAASAMGEKEAKALVARVWLRSHDGKPNVDELAELKDQNPEAYAIVKALLTKRSLGLLDPRHPTASFARGPSSDADEVPRGPAVFAKFASKTELAKMNTVSDTAETQQADVYPDAVQPVAPHRDFLNWKPSTDDDAMVKNVLGSVAELTSKPQSRSLLGQSRGVVTENAPVPVFSAPRVQAAAPVGPVAPAAPAASEESNEYLDSIGGFGVADSKPKPSLIKQSSQDSKNYLDSFSWDDNKKASSHTESSAAEASPLMADAADLMPEAPAATTAAPAKSAGNSGSALMKWLR